MSIRANRLIVIARTFGKTHGEAEDLQAFIDPARFLAADGGFDDIVDVGDVDAVAGDFVAVDLDLKIRKAAHLLDINVRRAALLCRGRAPRYRPCL